MTLRTARKVWFGNWRRYRPDVLERAKVRFLRAMGLSERQCARDAEEWRP